MFLFLLQQAVFLQETYGHSCKTVGTPVSISKPVLTYLLVRGRTHSVQLKYRQKIIQNHRIIQIGRDN